MTLIKLNRLYHLKQYKINNFGLHYLHCKLEIAEFMGIQSKNIFGKRFRGESGPLTCPYPSEVSGITVEHIKGPSHLNAFFPTNYHKIQPKRFSNLWIKTINTHQVSYWNMFSDHIKSVLLSKSSSETTQWKIAGYPLGKVVFRYVTCFPVEGSDRSVYFNEIYRFNLNLHLNVWI